MLFGPKTLLCAHKRNAKDSGLTYQLQPRNVYFMFISTGHASLKNIRFRKFQKLSQSRDKEVIPAPTIPLRNDLKLDNKIT